MMRAAAAALLMMALAGCGSVSVVYPGGLTRPKLVHVQFAASAAHSASRQRTIFHASESIAIEAGCLDAALSVGQPTTVVQMAMQVRRGDVYDFLAHPGDPARMMVLTGADATLSGAPHLTQVSLRVDELPLEVMARDGRKLAQVNFSDSDGANPFDAGARACRKLFAGWGPPAPPPAPLPPPRLVYLLSKHHDLAEDAAAKQRREGFDAGCTRAVEESGAKVAPLVTNATLPGTLWQILSFDSHADAFISDAVAYPADLEDKLVAALAVLADAHGVVRRVKWFDGSRWLGDPEKVGHDLCRDLLRP